MISAHDHYSKNYREPALPRLNEASLRLWRENQSVSRARPLRPPVEGSAGDILVPSTHGRSIFADECLISAGGRGFSCRGSGLAFGAR
jgi:hypothetical protein